MKELVNILSNIAFVRVSGPENPAITGIALDSRLVQPGFLFVAVSGTQTDGHDFIDKAIAAGAAAVVFQKPVAIPGQVAAIQVKDSAEALALIACSWYEHPSRKLKLTAVTGTNGKTTVATLLHALFLELGYRTGLLSTVENKINEEVIPSTHTTPDAIALNALLADMVKAGCSHAFMEASSHAIHQRRIAGLQFQGAVFTNLSHDHLDYHGTYDHYIAAKKMLFDGLPESAFSLVNADDKRARIMVQNTASKIRTYSLQTGANFRGRVISNTLQGLQMEINGKEVWFRLVGDFNAYNLTAVFGTAVLLGEKEDEVLLALSSLNPVRGRFERIPLGSGGVAIVDYAHTPDALINVLKTIKSMQIPGERIITVVGCGGNRDKTKRPIMAQAACKFSQQVILTSDNPRFEDPGTIIREMMDGVPFSSRRMTAIIEDREAAIQEAIKMAGPQDVVLIAGKGHETYQEINGVKYPFDDKEKVLLTQKPVLN
jgi:UDP-N-acetylmuramoyl-L-alanyl-D-glutamate--2,6-diaminopimelate ligase